MASTATQNAARAIDYATTPCEISATPAKPQCLYLVDAPAEADVQRHFRVSPLLFIRWSSNATASSESGTRCPKHR